MSEKPSIEAIADICLEAANAIFENRGSAAAQSGKPFPVTDADRASSAIFERKLGAFGLPVISEENDLRVPEKGMAWVVDPLDGTSDFVRGSADWCIMVALVRDRAAHAAMVYAPERGEWWHAAVGKGAFYGFGHEQRPIRVSSVTNTSDARMLMSATHPSKSAEAIRASIGAKSVQIGSMGIKLGRIAMGDAECYWSKGQFGEWDVCAPGLILSEAGGTVSDLEGNPLVYGNPDRHILNGFLASNGLLHETLLKANNA